MPSDRARGSRRSRLSPAASSSTFSRNLLHHRVAFGLIVLEGRGAGKLHERRRARQRRVDHLADRVGNLGAAATAKPSRQPLMLYDLLNVKAATHWSSMPGCGQDRRVLALSRPCGNTVRR